MLNAFVFEAIAKYFQRIETDLIWKTIGSPDGKAPGPRPDSFSDFQGLLMKTRARAVLLFNPIKPRPDKDDDCRKKDDCDCGCSDKVPKMLFEETGDRPCRDSGDCLPREDCIDGVCVPPIGGFTAADVGSVPLYDTSLRGDIDGYFTSIYEILASGLGRKPDKLPGVRSLLIDLYAGAQRISGTKADKCETDSDCKDGFVCRDGKAVPIPFRLVFHRLGDTLPPWPKG